MIPTIQYVFGRALTRIGLRFHSSDLAKAPFCLFADALTKVVMVGGPSAAPLLRQYEASALFVAVDGEVYTTPEWRDAAVLAA